MVLKCELAVYLNCWFNIFHYDSGETWLGNKKLYKHGEGNVCLSVLTGVAGLFQSGPSSKQEVCFARWGGDRRIFH